MRPIRNDATHWGWVSLVLHWVTVLLILALGLIGPWMTDLPSGLQKIQVYALHKSLGLTVLALTVLRLGWRLVAGAPPLVPMPRWQRLAAHGSHAALYALLLAMPLSGWLFNSAAGFPLRWFGLVKMPALAHYDKPLKALALEWHEGLFYVLLAVVAVHVAAAFKHHFIDRDDTARRMLPGLPPRARPSDTPP
jgi:cytochrome b561